MTPPQTHATPEAGSNDKEVTEAEPSEALASTGAANAEPQDATVKRLSSCTSISGQEGESAIAGSGGSSPSGGDSKREGNYASSSLGVADGGVLPLDLPVRRHSQDSEGNIDYSRNVSRNIGMGYRLICGFVSSAVCD